MQKTRIDDSGQPLVGCAAVAIFAIGMLVEMRTGVVGTRMPNY